MNKPAKLRGSLCRIKCDTMEHELLPMVYVLAAESMAERRIVDFDVKVQEMSPFRNLRVQICARCNAVILVGLPT